MLTNTGTPNKGWIDIYIHILPGMGDGTHGWDEAMALLKLAYGQGIRHIIATPHFTWNQDTGVLQELRTFLDYHMKAIPDGFSASLGQEIRYFRSLIEYLNQGKTLTLANGRYVLVESGPSDSLGRMKRAMRQLIQASYFPVIAYVERCRYFLEQKWPEGLVEYRAYPQINSRSLNGGWMDKRAYWCRENPKKGAVRFITTDMHNSSDCSPDTQTVVSWMEHSMGAGTAVRMTRTSPGHILQDKML